MRDMSKHDHIPTSEVEQDIADTECEIRDMEKEIEGFKLVGDKMSLFKAGARQSSVEERKVFIARLNAILDYRKEDTNDQ